MVLYNDNSLHVLPVYKSVLLLVMLYVMECNVAAQNDVSIISDIEHSEIIDQNAELLLEAIETMENAHVIKYNINSMSREEMLLLGLNNLQILSLENYILRTGQLLSLNELRFVNGFDTNTINKILPYVTATKVERYPSLRLDSVFKYASQQMRFQYIRDLNTPYGYTRNDGKGYNGDRFSSSFRYKMKYYDRLEFSFTGEKDYGEPVYKKDKIYGYDHYSASLTLRNLSKHVKQITIGDFRLNMGEGLAMKQSFSLGYFSSFAGAKHSNEEIMPFRSTTEYNYNTGIATKATIGKFDVLLFGSYNKIDFNGKTIQQTGYHRTDKEIEQKGANSVTLGGTSIQYWNRGLNFGITAFAYHYKDSLYRGNQTYQQYNFEGKDNNILSFNSSYSFGNKILFIEIARSKNNAFAELMGMQISMGYKSNLSVVVRNYSHKYQNTYSDAIGVQTHNHNERGLYVDYSRYYNKRLSLFTGADIFYFPQPSYRANTSSRGQRIRLQTIYKPNGCNEITTYLRFQNRQYNDTLSDGNIRPCNNFVFQPQIKYTIMLSNSFSLSDRIGYSHSFTNDADDNYGFYNYVELKFSSQNVPFTFNVRWNYFYTSDYDNRFYVYEYNLPLAYSSSLLYRNGHKLYALVSFKILKNLRIYLRYSLTRYNHTNEISSSNDKVSGNIRHYLGGQILYEF